MSDKPMTQNELDDIRRRLEVATPGPWAFEKEDGKVLLDYTPKEIRICETGCLGSIANRMVCDMNVDWRYTYKNENEPMANAEFIAHAPTDIARLMAEVERLRGEVARLEKSVNGWQDECESAQRCADVATQQVRLLAKKLFDNRICHKSVLCKQANAKDLKFEDEDGCGFCWEEWAWHLAAYEIEEAKRNV